MQQTMCTIYDMLIPCKKLYWLELTTKGFFQFSHLGDPPWLFLVSGGFPPSWYWMSLLVPIRSNHQNRGFLNWKPITVFGDVVKTTRIGILIDSTFNLVCWRDWLPANCNCGRDYAGQEGGRVWIKRCKISLSKYLHIFANIGVSPTSAHSGLFAPRGTNGWNHAAMSYC